MRQAKQISVHIFLSKLVRNYSQAISNSIINKDSSYRVEPTLANKKVIAWSSLSLIMVIK